MKHETCNDVVDSGEGQQKPYGFKSQLRLVSRVGQIKTKSPSHGEETERRGGEQVWAEQSPKV